MLVRTLALTTLIALGTTATGYACSLPPGVPAPTKEEQFSSASAVFVGHLTRVEETTDQVLSRSTQGLIVEGTFRLVEALKGTPPADNKVRSLIFGPGNCTIPFLAGTDYVFFTRDSAAFITFLDGSVLLSNPEAAVSKEFLWSLRSLQK
jgi:hypothetical protein